MRGEVAVKYAPALVLTPLGAIDPVYAGIAFGMVTGWLAIMGVMIEQRRSFADIRRAVVVSVMIGGGGALFAAFAARKLHADPLTATMLAFGIAFGGVRTIKMLTGTATAAVNWLLGSLIGSLIDDAAKMGRERQRAQKLLVETDRENRERLNLQPRIEE